MKKDRVDPLISEEQLKLGWSVGIALDIHLNTCDHWSLIMLVQTCKLVPKIMLKFLKFIMESVNNT